MSNAPKERTATRTDLRDDVHRIANILGQPPTTGEYDKFGNWSSTTVLWNFPEDSWEEIMEGSMGFPEYDRKQLTDKQLAEDLWILAASLGRPPKRKDMQAFGGHGAYIYLERFGCESWEEVLETFGMVPKYRGVPGQYETDLTAP